MIQNKNLGQLVEMFVQISEAQSAALLADDVASFNREFDAMIAVENELRLRHGDQRRELLSLFDHPNAQVRLNAIKATLALAPDRGRQALESLAKSAEYPQSMDAGMCIQALADGTFRPT